MPGKKNRKDMLTIIEVMQGEKADWRRVHFFIIDERLVPIDHPASNYKLLQDHFIDTLAQAGKITPENAHPLIFDPALSDRGVQNYERVLAEQGYRYDIILLSSGDDGHVAALYPDHHSFADQHHGYIVIDDSPKTPMQRITSSLSLIQTAEVAVLLFVGGEKRQAYGKFKDAACPAKLVLAIQDTTVFTDPTQG